MPRLFIGAYARNYAFKIGFFRLCISVSRAHEIEYCLDSPSSFSHVRRAVITIAKVHLVAPHVYTLNNGHLT